MAEPGARSHRQHRGEGAARRQLNRDGIEVTNDAGDGTWTLTGDGHLDASQSADYPARGAAVCRQHHRSRHHGDAISISATFFARVWNHVPRPDAGIAAPRSKALTNDYTSPDSHVAGRRGRRDHPDELDTLIKMLIDEHKLRVA